ncbi:MAG: 3-hydroxyisobutyrate dehydrogenase [Tepidimonas sp.]|uniref:3-hydroxyisobutyrate dehydrogenase n=1 Tax=Tepidimonas sp. TaxID=2002775 RepID=UPI00298F10C6|nr:3-hydroxyisobutyrate dehydrogenase [Tepidimonas sp.]MDW8336086.1 3-hydroxyisobutyrate dehydrogenase [Tepidimonas sp.]
MPRIAFVGLGNMGCPMAAHLHRAGCIVHGYDVNPSAMVAAQEQGIPTTPTLAQAIQDAEVVISMLPASRHVQTLYLGQEAGGAGVLQQLKPGSMIVDCSTIAPDTARQIGAAAKAKGIAMIDAPVSGGVTGARSGSLTFIVGGDPADLERARPLLQIMGRHIFHMGPIGSGQVAKLCNNMVLGVIMAATAEALTLGVAQGLDARVLSQMMAVSTGRSWVTEACNPWPGVMDNAPATRGYTGGFSNDLMLKDLGLAIEAALSTQTAVPLGALARNLYALNSAAGRGGLDFSSIVQLFARHDP